MLLTATRAITLSLILAISACKAPTLFETNHIPAAKMTEFVLMNPEPPTLAPGDKITISIWGHNDLSIGSINSPYMSDEATGRWVILDKEGEVNLPKIGRVSLVDYNVKEAAYFLEELYAKHIENPVINVRVLNHFVTVLGEVKNPGKYQIDNEEVRLVQLIGEAEGLTKYAKHDEIFIIREVDGKMVKFPVNFTSLAVINERNAVIRPDDIVYVPPVKRKKSDEVISRTIPVASIITGAALVVSAFVR